MQEEQYEGEAVETPSPTSERLFDRIARLDKPGEKRWSHAAWPDTEILLKTLSVGERAKWAKSIEITRVRPGRNGKHHVKEVKALDEVTFQFLKRTSFNPLTGEPVIQSDNDIHVFRELNAAVVDDWYKAAAALNGIGKDEDEDGDDPL